MDIDSSGANIATVTEERGDARKLLKSLLSLVLTDSLL